MIHGAGRLWLLSFSYSLFIRRQVKNKMEKNCDKTTQTEVSLLPFREPESTVTLVARVDKHECNHILDPSECQNKQCPYSTGELTTQRWIALERMYQLTKTIEATTSTFVFNTTIFCSCTHCATTSFALITNTYASSGKELAAVSPISKL